MTIQEWLDKCGSLTEGVRLLEQLGEDTSAYEPWLKKPAVPGRLYREMAEKLKHHLNKSPAKNEFNSVPAQEPEAVRILRERGRKLLKMRADLHTRMKMASTDAERFQIADELIRKVSPEVDRVYNALRDYEREGIVPSVPPPDLVQQVVGKMQRVNSLRSILSRHRKRLEREPNEMEKKRIMEDINAKENELHALLDELGMNND